jgi:hypothetical protein
MRPLLFALFAPVVLLGGCASLGANNTAAVKSTALTCPMMGDKSMSGAMPGAMQGGKESDSAAMMECMKKMQPAGAPPASGADEHDHKDKP